MQGVPDAVMRRAGKGLPRDLRAGRFTRQPVERWDRSDIDEKFFFLVFMALGIKCRAGRIRDRRDGHSGMGSGCSPRGPPNRSACMGAVKADAAALSQACSRMGGAEGALRTHPLDATRTPTGFARGRTHDGIETITRPYLGAQMAGGARAHARASLRGHYGPSVMCEQLLRPGAHGIRASTA